MKKKAHWPSNEYHKDGYIGAECEICGSDAPRGRCQNPSCKKHPAKATRLERLAWASAVTAMAVLGALVSTSLAVAVYLIYLGER